MNHSALGRRWGALLSAAGLAVAGALVAAAPAHAAGTTLVINEVYGGGGNSGATYTHDFVELYNGTSTAIDLNDYVVQYYSAAGNTGGAANTCRLSGSIAPGDYFLIQQAAGAGGTTPLPTPDQVCNAAMAANNGSVRLFDAAGGTVDTVGYGTTVIFEGERGPTLSNTTSASRTDGIDTDNNRADFRAGTPTPQNSGTGAPPEPEPVITPIAEIQGTGTQTPFAGRTVTTEGVVTAAYPTGGFAGIYIQTPGSGGVAKTPGDASDGIFVFSNWAANNVEIGDCVEVEGVAGEYTTGGSSLTQIAGQTVVTVKEEPCEAVVATELATLPVTDAEKEVYEGMLVQPLGTYTITNNYQLNQFGQIGLAVGDEPLYTATDVVRPGPEAIAYEAENLTKYITLDDGSSWNLMSNNTARNDYALPYLSHETPMRTASHVTFTAPVILDWRFQWNYQPVTHIHGHDHPQIPISSENDRPESAPALSGNLMIGAFNVLNYFDDLGQDEEAAEPSPTASATRSARTSARCAARTASRHSRISRPNSSPRSTRAVPTSLV